ncbi:lipoate--protein ligase [Streptococcus constellatus]|uniref:lipoate--protein ligase n=1 Tax=Streptococcus constellatus TaxID=76860 RepID=UPI00065FE47C|nr:lipoate--protein ligase [Streptococcus constellatus]KXU02370.1 Lipoate-protein ligase A [Streptococcus constellatus]
MKYIINNSNDTAFNIALEEYAFKHLLDEDQIFLLWINKPSIIVGRHQNTVQEINRDYVREHGIEVVRRISGGGAVYHDLNNLNYTIISKEDENKAFDFKSFSTPVIKTLEELGVKAEFTGRNDLEIDGKKFCGNAQAYINGRIMHHGCLLFDVDLPVLAQALQVSKDKFESKGVQSVRARVTNIVDELPEKITVEEFKNLLLGYMKKEYPEMTEYVLSDQELAEIRQIRDSKFANWDWNYGKSPEYNVRRGTKFTSGKVEVFANVVESKIQDIKIYGDFFGIEDVAAVEAALRGVKYEREDILQALSSLDISRYFAGISKEEIAEAVVG